MADFSRRVFMPLGAVAAVVLGFLAALKAGDWAAWALLGLTCFYLVVLVVSNAWASWSPGPELRVRVERFEWRNFRGQARILQAELSVTNRTARRKEISELMTEKRGTTNALLSAEVRGEVARLEKEHTQLKAISVLEPRRKIYGWMVLPFSVGDAFGVSGHGTPPYKIQVSDETGTMHEAALPSSTWRAAWRAITSLRAWLRKKARRGRAGRRPGPSGRARTTAPHTTTDSTRSESSGRTTEARRYQPGSPCIITTLNRYRSRTTGSRSPARATPSSCIAASSFLRGPETTRPLPAIVCCGSSAASATTSATVHCSNGFSGSSSKPRARGER
jgi:hypothetical protein